MNRKSIGEKGEKLAADFLKKKGFRILDKNYRCREGEIDIVAERKKNIVFVEVRTKTGTAYGLPEESISRSKREKLIIASFQYLASHNLSQMPWRIDFIGIELNPEGKVSRMEHIENAITG